MKSNKYDMGGSLQQLLPLLDLAAPGLGTAASTVAGVLQQANAFNKQTTPLKSPTNPFRSYRDGGLIKVGNNEFDPKDIRASKKGNYFIGKDKNTGESFGLVVEDGKYRYKKSTDKSKLDVTTGKDYESLKPNHVTTEADLKLIQDNAAKYYRELYNSDFYKRNQPESVRVKNLNKLNKYDKGELLYDPVIAPKGGGSYVTESVEGKPRRIVHDPTMKDWKDYKGSDNRTTMTHEFSHAIDGLTQKDINLITPKLNKGNIQNNHDASPEEMKSDIDALRRSMKDRGVWDMKSNFNQKHLDKYREVNPEGFDLNRIRRLTKSDEDMLQLMNSVSYVDSKPELPMARKGGILPQLKFGGKVKEYNLPTHEQGGGMIDKMGNPGNQPVAEIEKKEVVYTDKRGTNPYVFSDTLTDSDGKTFAMKAKEYQKFDKKDQVNQATYKKLMNELQMKNDLAREMEQPTTNQEGLPRFDPGGTLPGSQAYYDKNGALIQNDQLDSIINYDRTQAGYKNLLGNLQSGAFPMLPSMNTIPSGSMSILDNARANPLVSQTPLDITQPQPTTQPTKNPLGSLDLGKVGGILKGVALAGSAVDAFQRPEQEQLRVPDFSKGDKAYTGLGGSFDPIRNDIVQQAKSGENQIMQSAGNFGQVMSRLNSLQAGVGRNLAQVGLQEKQYNDQIRTQKGQREDNKAQITASEQIRKQTADSQNKAMGQDLVANLLQNVNNYGTEFMKQDAMTKQLAALDKEKQRAFLTQLSLMNIKNPNFQINKDLINSDNPLSALTFKQ